MIRNRVWAIAIGCAVILAAGYWLLDRSGRSSDQHAGKKGHEAEHAEDGGVVRLTPEQIEKAGIRITEAGPGQIAREVRVVGRIVPDADRVVHVVTRVAGILTEVTKRPGDEVAAGEVLAVLDSRELAEAKADYLALLRQEQLARTTLQREAALWKQKISAEQDYLTAKAAAETARIRLDAARQRLVTLGLSDAELKALPELGERSLSRLEVRAPSAGQVIAREGGRGELVAAEKEIYTVADLSVVWVEIPVYGSELPYLRKGQRVLLKGPSGRTGEGRLVFISPTSDPQTGAARAVAELDNASSEWRPGDFLSGMIATESEPADIAVPVEALQMLAGETVVFVRTNEGFDKRIVEIGRRNARSAEIVFGLFPGDRIAASNTFLLKAEASRGSAEHAHSH